MPGYRIPASSLQIRTPSNPAPRGPRTPRAGRPTPRPAAQRAAAGPDRFWASKPQRRICRSYCAASSSLIPPPASSFSTMAPVLAAYARVLPTPTTRRPAPGQPPPAESAPALGDRACAVVPRGPARRQGAEPNLEGGPATASHVTETPANPD